MALDGTGTFTCLEKMGVHINHRLWGLCGLLSTSLSPLKLEELQYVIPLIGDQVDDGVRL